MKSYMAALRTIILADATVVDLVLDRVYGGGLPKDQAPDMARPTVVLRMAGGIGDQAYLPTSENRVDVFSYGETFEEAETLFLAVHDVLKAIKRQTVDGCMVYRCNRTSGPINFRDPDVDWPVTVESWSLLAGEPAIA